MKKKVLAVAAATVMAATAVGALAGCKDPKTTISVFLLANSHEMEFYQDYFKEMEKQLKDEGLEYKIDFSGEQEGNYYDNLDADIQGGSIPDIFYVRPNELMLYKSNIIDLQDYADEYGFTTDATKQIADLNVIYPTALDMYRFNPTTGEVGNPADHLYAFPKDLSTQQLGYNKKLLQKYEQTIKATKNAAGTANLKMPWDMDFKTENYSWEDFKIMCKAIADKIVADKETNKVYPCDVPPIEVLARSYGTELIDLTNGRKEGKVTSVATGALNDAIKFQAEFLDCGAGDYENATYANFSAGKVCFYGAVGSWEVADYNTLLGEGQWDVMPWPTKDGSTDWTGLITSAGYVISKNCAEKYPEKCEVAKRIALSFMSADTQDWLVKEEKISLPLRETVKDDYLEQDDVYSPANRWVFINVINGDNGEFPAKYSTYDSKWLGPLDDALAEIWGTEKGGKGKALAKFNSTTWSSVASQMQAQYDATKNY